MSVNRISKDQIKTELRRLGLAKGDLVFVSSDLMKVGYFNKDRDTTMRDWVDILLTAVGSTGTIVVPSYSPAHIRFIQRSNFVFDKDSDSDSGSLATAFLSFADDVVRGAHPTSSCVAVGPLAQHVAGDHGVRDPAYKPYGRIIEHSGRNLMLGTVDTKNCPMSFHYAQQVLGHARTHPLCGLLQTRYRDEHGNIEKFVVREVGGCTRGVHKCWGYLLAKNGVSIDRVGRTQSALVDTKIAFDVLKSVLEKNPGLVRCTNRDCISCHGRYRYNGARVIPFYVRKTFSLLRKRLIDKSSF
jgi:aminoglycoside 3-N-acetyltransferase